MNEWLWKLSRLHDFKHVRGLYICKYSPVNLNELLEDLKIELDNISNRMRNKKLCLNASKSEYILIAHKRRLKRTGNGSGVACKYSLGILSLKDIIGSQGRTQHWKAGSLGAMPAGTFFESKRSRLSEKGATPFLDVKIYCICLTLLNFKVSILLLFGKSEGPSFWKLGESRPPSPPRWYATERLGLFFPFLVGHNGYKSINN